MCVRLLDSCDASGSGGNLLNSFSVQELAIGITLLLESQGDRDIVQYCPEIRSKIG